MLFPFQLLLQHLEERAGHKLLLDWKLVQEASQSIGIELELPLDDMRHLGYTIHPALVPCKVYNSIFAMLLILHIWSKKMYGKQLLNNVGRIQWSTRTVHEGINYVYK